MQHRKLKAFALALALSAAAGGVPAQDFVFGWSPRTGDVWVDTRLSDINDYGYRYRDPFIHEMNRYYGAPRDLVSELLVRRRWAPGDVYYACAIAQIIGRPCGYVVDVWERDHGQGWGVVAQRLGIKPGSAEFHRLKRGFVPTYDRWDRPIVLDRELQRAFPDRGKGKPAHAGPDRGKPAQAGGKDKGKAGQGGNQGNQGDKGKGGKGNKGGKGKD